MIIIHKGVVLKLDKFFYNLEEVGINFEIDNKLTFIKFNYLYDSLLSPENLVLTKSKDDVRLRRRLINFYETLYKILKQRYIVYTKAIHNIETDFDELYSLPYPECVLLLQYKMEKDFPNNVINFKLSQSCKFNETTLIKNKRIEWFGFNIFKKLHTDVIRHILSFIDYDYKFKILEHNYNNAKLNLIKTNYSLNNQIIIHLIILRIGYLKKIISLEELIKYKETKLVSNCILFSECANKEFILIMRNCINLYLDINNNTMSELSDQIIKV